MKLALPGIFSYSYSTKTSLLMISNSYIETSQLIQIVINNNIFLIIIKWLVKKIN